MQVPYCKGVANYTDPESCVAARESCDEALTGAHAGWVLSRVNIYSSGAPTLSKMSEGNTALIAIARSEWAPRGRRPHACMETHCAGTGLSLIHI